ncbi:glycerol-3-phosphate dehydrogenase [Herbaspirillum sp. LeCh32-8]|uniref:glycerol-3-phosphate dehydrogenase n=1 Tax=Herbaspirillum sp. LeCh32-8 TaxID=2821356 RepID=UPI001AE868E9|nr:glycerol-3-phosphate dehydrogenase [Herbaspirillum sp. LeCh32-8]MBP0598769.1 glycerol-3-phosphate dehydrogenase [Herbaspirillum sp. LeCh32-8]
MALEYDLLVVGGGINGAGIARDAAGRGLRVLLCEQHDLAQHTSSASTKLIHGGLRYLEYYEFKLVRKALQEREVLLRAAPHIIWPLRFVMPHDASQRPAWMIRAGLFLYDTLAKREILPASHGLNLREHAAGQPLKGDYRRGFVYSDGWVDDARLVTLNALDAHERGARILTRTKCVSARRDGERWHAVLESEANGRTQVLEVQARAIVNAAGPWAARFAQGVPGAKKNYGLRLIKGSHIVVKRLFDHPCAYIFQNPDKRIIFAIPYQDDFTLIGTTDLEYHGDAGRVEISGEEVAYLCEMANRYFTRQITAADVVWTYSGVRPLLDDSSENASAVTRDYLLECDAAGAPMLNVWGGKITTYRKLAEEALAMLSSNLGLQDRPWTDGAPLPGGDLQHPGKLVRRYDFDAFLQDVQRRYPWLPAQLAKRYARSYGARLERLIGTATSLAELGEELAPGLYEAEARYLVSTEWARSADDILWRRSKLGLYCQPQHVARLEAWLAQEHAGAAPLQSPQAV